MENKTIGIIGAGQLALMIIQAGSRFGTRFICLDPNPNSPAFMYSDEYIIKDYSDIEGLQELAQKSDVILYEFENIDLDALKKIDQSKLLAGIDVLDISKNRLREKKFAQKSGYKVVNYMSVNNADELEIAKKEIGYPAILKTSELGYDGKGQIVLNSDSDLEKAKELIEVECIYEQKLEFDYEMSVISVRSRNNQIATFTPFINNHHNSILHTTTISNNHDLNIKVQKLIENFMTDNQFYGILCIEMFIKDGEIYFNEMAPRPHNSGHITIDAVNVSQFEQFVRSALEYKLLKPQIIQDMMMINILGQHYDKAIDILKTSDNKHIYLYGKDQIKNNRKMGHINCLNNDESIKLSLEFKNAK